MLQYKRLILDTPFSKIRSASMGLVEISGTPNGPQTIASAITGQPCYYYRARAWQFSDSGKGGNWAQVIDESLFVPFFLEDSTGRVRIDPQGATLDVHRSFFDEMQTSSLGIGSPVPEAIRNFVAQRGLLAGDKIRLEEQIIKPGFPLFVYGTLGENSVLGSWAAQPHHSNAQLSLGSSSPRSVSLKFSYKGSGSEMAPRMIGAMLTRLPGTKSVSVHVNTPPGGGPAVIPDQMMESLHRMGIPLPSSVVSESMNLRSSPVESAKSSAISVATSVAAEINVLPPPATGERQTSLASRTPATSDFDLHARVAIGKGPHGNPFTISSQSQREVVQSLAWKSTLYIWGSPIFTLVCIYFLLVYWSWM